MCTTVEYPKIQAEQDAREARAVVEIILRAAESGNDEDFGRLRNNAITLFYLAIEKLNDAEKQILASYDPAKGAFQ